MTYLQESYRVLSLCHEEKNDVLNRGEMSEGQRG